MVLNCLHLWTDSIISIMFCLPIFLLISLLGVAPFLSFPLSLSLVPCKLILTLYVFLILLFIFSNFLDFLLRTVRGDVLRLFVCNEKLLSFRISDIFKFRWPLFHVLIICFFCYLSLFFLIHCYYSCTFCDILTSSGFFFYRTCYPFCYLLSSHFKKKVYLCVPLLLVHAIIWYGVPFCDMYVYCRIIIIKKKNDKR